MSDLRTWVKSYATGSLVSPEMQKERLTWVTLPPNTPEHHYGLGIGEDHGWLGHTGELPGYNTAAYYLPAKKAVIVVMVNSDIPVGKTNPAPAIFKAMAAVLTPAERAGVGRSGKMAGRTTCSIPRSRPTGMNSKRRGG